jgi:hypothetical protein
LIAPPGLNTAGKTPVASQVSGDGWGVESAGDVNTVTGVVVPLWKNCTRYPAPGMAAAVNTLSGRKASWFSHVGFPRKLC